MTALDPVADVRAEGYRTGMRRPVAYLAAIVALGISGEANSSRLNDLIGMTVESHSSHIGGWNIESRQSWCVSGDFDPNCSMLQLRSEQTVVVALTRPTKRSGRGGVDAEIIFRVFAIELPLGAEPANCRDVNHRPAVFGWLDHRSHTASIYTTDGQSLNRTVLTYSSDEDEPCEIGQD